MFTEHRQASENAGQCLGAAMTGERQDSEDPTFLCSARLRAAGPEEGENKPLHFPCSGHQGKQARRTEERRKARMPSKYPGTASYSKN